ncbi:hypothetical protein ILYODFUR_007335 [Ilyodon furcidens]|uniref:Uncharacterized protein n=1 Tax=Ilyodon furcidens TaxID=33524 RepID=A0ABV0TKP6_9TELE
MHKIFTNNLKTALNLLIFCFFLIFFAFFFLFFFFFCVANPQSTALFFFHSHLLFVPLSFTAFFHMFYQVSISLRSSFHPHINPSFLPLSHQNTIQGAGRMRPSDNTLTLSSDDFVTY